MAVIYLRSVYATLAEGYATDRASPVLLIPKNGVIVDGEAKIFLDVSREALSAALRRSNPRTGFPLNLFAVPKIVVPSARLAAVLIP